MDRQRRHAPRRLLLAVVLAGSLVAMVPSAVAQPVDDAVATSRAEAQPEQARPATDPRLRWKPCGPPQGLQCAQVRVPLDWDRPKARTIRLAVIRHLASKPDERIGTLFVNPGGPGDTGVGLVRGDPEGVDAIGGGRFDVVSWDPRGTNASTRVRCFESRENEERFWAGATIPTTAAEARRTQRTGTALARRCGEVSGWLLPHISTADTARDLDHLRRLVGERKLTYVGFSYGTYLGQTYANMFPDRIRAMLLDAVVDPVKYSKSAETRMASWSASPNEVFDQFLALCQDAGPQQCALAGDPSAAQRWDRLVARLKRGPLPAPSANTTSLSRPTLSYGDLLISQFQPLRAPRSWPDNAANIGTALRGDGSALANDASLFLTPDGWGAATTSAAIQCVDGPARNGPESSPRMFERLQRIAHSRDRSTSPGSGHPAQPGPCEARTPIAGRGTPRPRTRSC